MLNYTIIKKIDDGLSKDIKYIVTLNRNDKKYLLRISDFSDKKINAYKVISKIYTDCNASALLDYYVVKDKIYAFFDYIDGTPLKLLMPSITNKQKYNYGIQAGKILRLLHSRYNNQILNCTSNLKMANQILDNYKNFELKNETIDLLYNFCIDEVDNIDFEQHNFLNADFHSMNMIVNQNMLYLIDLEKYEYGDPTRDFTFIFTCNEDRTFASGMINGYHNSQTISRNFWTNFKFFSTLTIIQYYMWNLTKFNKINDSIEIANEFLYEYNENMNIPNWYLKNGSEL